MADIKSKSELDTDIDTLFPDNGAEGITALNVRTFLKDFLASNLVEEVLTITSTPVAVANTVDSVIADTGADQIDIPTTASYKDRKMFVTNISSSVVTLFPSGEVINGQATYKLAPNTVIQIIPDAGASNWVVIVIARPKARANYYFEGNGVDVPVGAPAAYVPIGGTLLASGTIKFFTVVDTVITYTGDDDIEVDISWGAMVDSQSANQTFGGKVFKNEGLGGEVELDGRMFGFISNDNFRGYSLNTTTTLVTGDTLTLMGTNFDGSQDPLVTDTTIRVTEV